MTDDHLDGNAVAGDLAELLGTDLTDATGTCAGCGAAGVLAAARVYGRGPGWVLRCATCDHVLARLVRTTRHVVFDLGGLRTVRAALPTTG